MRINITDTIKKNIEDENKKTLDLISNIDTTGIKVYTNSQFGKSGYTISHYANNSFSDLLVINSPDVQMGFLDRVFTHDIEYILADLPCNLLVVHSRVQAD